MPLTFLKQMKRPQFLYPNPLHCYLALGKSACHSKAEQLARIFRKLRMKPIPEKLRWISVHLQVFIYRAHRRANLETFQSAITRGHHPSILLTFSSLIAPKLVGKAAGEGQGAQSRAPLTSLHEGRAVSTGSWPPTMGSSTRLHRARAPPAADVGFYCSGLPYHWATCTAHLTHSSYSVAVCAEITLAGSSS